MSGELTTCHSSVTSVAVPPLTHDKLLIEEPVVVNRTETDALMAVVLLVA